MHKDVNQAFFFYISDKLMNQQDEVSFFLFDGYYFRAKYQNTQGPVNVCVFFSLKDADEVEVTVTASCVDVIFNVKCTLFFLCGGNKMAQRIIYLQTY